MNKVHHRFESVIVVMSESACEDKGEVSVRVSVSVRVRVSENTKLLKALVKDNLLTQRT